jgi:hypothetical protein
MAHTHAGTLKDQRNQNIQNRNQRLTEISTKLDELIIAELARIDAQVNFLDAVRSGRGVGAIRNRIGLDLKTITEERVDDFLNLADFTNDG